MLFFKMWRKVLRRLPLILQKNVYQFLFCFGLLFLIIWKSTPNINVIEEIRLHAFDPKFSGATACGNFPCFGQTLCGWKENGLTSLNHTVIRGVKGWLMIDGIIKNGAGKKQTVTLNYPYFDHCTAATCQVTVKLKKFSRSGYRNWICRNFGFKENCDVELVLHDWPPMRQILKDGGRLNPEILKELSPPLRCASPRLADRLLRRVLGSLGKGSTNIHDYTYPEKAGLVLMAKLSPHYIMQKMFPRYEGWYQGYSPGVCGLMTLTVRKPFQSLYDLYHAPWKQRLDVAIQLLQLACLYTENDDGFIMLLHQITPHDIGIMETKLLHIENPNNIIIVDTSDPKKDFLSSMFETPYDRHRFFVPEENLCRYNRTDINYYTVCRHFLTGSWKGLNGDTVIGGILHDPEELSKIQSQMSVLLDICNRGSIAISDERPKTDFSARKEAVKRLLKLFHKLRPCSPQYPYNYPECDLMAGFKLD